MDADGDGPWKGYVSAAAVALAAVVVFGNWGDSASPSAPAAVKPVNDIAAQLLPKRQQCRANVAELQTLGVRIVDRGDASTVFYPEVSWAAFTHENKVQQALLVYCAKMPASGRYSVLVHGERGGKLLGSVVDGSYFSD